MNKQSASTKLSLATPMQPVLPSWREGRAKTAILDFVMRVTSKSGPHHVPHEERVAVFDNDGTLWPEKPMIFQAAFAIDRLKLLANHHARWTEAPLAHAMLTGDLSMIAAAGERRVQDILAWTHAGLSTEEFEKIIGNWSETSHHPQLNRCYCELAYRPMQELLVFLRANGFKLFVVSGGGAEFARVLAEQMYDVPSERVIGSSSTTRFEFQAGTPRLIKQSRVEYVDDGAGKPSTINRFIGRRPIFAMGNSDEDQQMLQWVDTGDVGQFVGLIHHTDSVREFAYDRELRGGRLEKALSEARVRNWTIVDMAKDWARVFAERE